MTPETLTESALYLEWKAADDKRESFFVQETRRMRAALNRQIAPVILAVERGETNIDRLADLISNDPIREAFTQLYPIVGVAFARKSWREIRAGKFSTKSADEPVSDWMNFMRNFALREAGERIRNIGRTTLKWVRRVLDKAVADGLSIDNTVKLMTQEAEEINKIRARIISRTEILSSSNHGSYVGAKSTGLPLDKIWISTRDKRTRRRPDDPYDHLAADGERVDIDAKFEKTGEALLFPGHPDGSKGNVIACRCSIGWKAKGAN